MAQIRVLQPFTLNLGATMQRFAPGTVDVSEEVADHWYTKLFAERITPAPVAEPASPALADESESPSRNEGDPQQPGVDPERDAPEGDASESQPGDVPGGPDQTEPPAQEGDAPAAASDDNKAALKAEAEALGIAVDGRWGVERIKTAIAEAKGA